MQCTTVKTQYNCTVHISVDTCRTTDLVVELAVDWLSLLVDQLEGVWAIAIHVAIAIRYSPITKQEGNLVCGLRTKRNEVPEHVNILIHQKHTQTMEHTYAHRTHRYSLLLKAQYHKIQTYISLLPFIIRDKFYAFDLSIIEQCFTLIYRDVSLLYTSPFSHMHTLKIFMCISHWLL